MNFLTKETKSGQTNLGAIVVLPSQAEFSDIEELQQCNRGANEPLSELDELIKSIKAREGIVTPLKGYLEGKRLRITAGSRRLAAAQALEAEGTIYNLPVVLISKPETAEQIASAILDSAVDNEFRKADSPVVLHASFSVLRELGKSYEEIGELTGFSHQKAYNLLKAFEVKPLREAIIKGEISDRASADFFTEQYKVIDPKTKKPAYRVEEVNGKKVKKAIYDEEKIRKALTEAKATANAAGKSIVGAGSAHEASGKQSGPGIRAIKIILDEPEDNVPVLFRLFSRWVVGDINLELLQKSAKKNNLIEDIEWLFDIEFDVEKRKQAREKAKAVKAKKAKKANPLVEEEELDSFSYE